MHTDGKFSINTTKRTIFLSAAELFAERGYHGVSMKDIADKACITAASIYYHYKSKEEIMENLLEYYLERFEGFYLRLGDAEFDTSDGLNSLLNQLVLTYNEDEVQLMYYLTRVVHHEQFQFRKAAEALIGSGYKKYVNAHTKFLDRLSDAGYLSGKENNRYYAELYARISLTFGTQFLHPEVDHTISEHQEVISFLNQLVICHENSKKKQIAGE